MKKLLIALFAAAAFTVSAQTARSGSWAIEFPKEGKAVNVSQTFTPFFKIENEERVIDMRLNERDMSNAKHWLAVDVAFSTNKPKSAAQWPKWLDNVEVEVNIFLPTNDDRGNVVWSVIGGKQTLASLQANDGRHFVRMMIPPEVIYRYFVFDGVSDISKDYNKITSDLKKMMTDLPIMAAISYGGRTVYGFQNCGKEVFSRLDKTQGSNQRAKLFYTLLKGDGDGSPTATTTAKLFDYIIKNKFNPQTFKYMPDELLPVSKTPFAWVLFDRFEPIKESAGK
ncbi:MAG: hypothetical protein J6Y92_06920 [Lentisphaeria bacterium]|nr:hypothetical protein [Lentisphaeria bacterium]